MRSNLTRLGLIVVTWTVLSALLFLSAHYYLLASVAPGAPPGSYDPRTNLVGWVGSALVGGLLFGSLMVFPLHRRVRRRSLGYGIAYNTVVFLVLYSAAVFLVTMAVAFAAEPSHSPRELAAIGGRVLSGPAAVVGMGVWALVVAATQFMLQVSDKFGTGVLASLLIGRYVRPRTETRIFMFLDLASSTTLAERLGHARYFEFIREFVADVTDPILAHRGEIYQYVGDEVVVSWRLSGPDRNADCIRCFFAVEDRIRALAGKYDEEFGASPEFKAGMHLGPVTVGEIGIVRREIVFSGDVLNTTSRIQSECNRLGRRLLVSRPLLDAVRLGPAFALDDLGEIDLRGREERIGLGAVGRQRHLA